MMWKWRRKRDSVQSLPLMAIVSGKVNWVLTDYSVCNYSANHMRLVKSALQKIDLNIADSAEATEAYKKVFGIQNVITIHNLMNTEKVEKGKTKTEDQAEMILQN